MRTAAAAARSAMTRQVVFSPSGRRGAFPEGTTVLDAARALGVDLDSVCGGRGICGRCQVVIGSRPGIEARADRLVRARPNRDRLPGPATAWPRPSSGLCGEGRGRRSHRCSPDSQVHRQVVRKRAGVGRSPCRSRGPASLRRGPGTRSGQPDRRPGASPHRPRTRVGSERAGGGPTGAAAICRPPCVRGAGP